jgi:hypothetical protein
MGVRAAALPLGLAAMLVLTGCAGQAASGAAGPSPSPSASPSPAPLTRVPEVPDGHLPLVDKVFPAAGLVALVRYEPGLLDAPGKVALTDPPAGASVPMGSVVRVVVAGAPADLDQYVDGNGEVFVGSTVDAEGTLVLAVYQKAQGLAEAVEGAKKYTGGKTYRVVTCPRSRVDLERLRIELSRRTFLPRAAKLEYATGIDVASCALRLTADITDVETEQLAGRFGDALVIERRAGYTART